MGSAPQSKAVRDVTLTSKLVEMTLRTAKPKFRSVGTSAMPTQQIQPLRVQSSSVLGDLGGKNLPMS